MAEADRRIIIKDGPLRWSSHFNGGHRFSNPGVQLHRTYDNVTFALDDEGIEDETSFSPMPEADYMENDNSEDEELDITSLHVEAPATESQIPNTPSTAMSVPRLSVVSTKGRTHRREDEEELLFRLKVAHLSPQTDWYQEILMVSEDVHDSYICGHVLDNLRGYPMPMQKKLKLSRRLHKNISRRNRLSSFGNRREMRRAMRNEVKKVSRFSQFIPSSIELWGTSIGKISAFFGSSVASYFQFLRYVFLLNAGLGIIMFIFMTLPQIITGDMYDHSIRRGGIIGGLSRTIFFYGAYNSSVLEFEIPGARILYNLPLAYLATWFLVSVMALVIILFSMFLKYRRVKRSSYSHDDPYSAATLLAWDYGVTEKQGSDVRRKTVGIMIKEMIRDDRNLTTMAAYSKLRLYTVRFFCHFLSLAILAGSAFAIYKVATIRVRMDSGLPKVFVTLINRYKLSMSVAVMKLAVPPLFTLLLVAERYSPRTTIKMEIARTACYYVASLVVFIASIYSVAQECISINASNSTETTTSYPFTDNLSTNYEKGFPLITGFEDVYNMSVNPTTDFRSMFESMNSTGDYTTTSYDSTYNESSNSTSFYTATDFENMYNQSMNYTSDYTTTDLGTAYNQSLSSTTAAITAIFKSTFNESSNSTSFYTTTDSGNMYNQSRNSTSHFMALEADSNDDTIAGDTESLCCWENQVGEQLLQLVVLDFLTSIVVRLMEGLQTVLVKCFQLKKLGYPYPHVSRLVLDLVYSQCLVWLGAYLMPALALLSAVRLALLFHVTKAIFLSSCVPPDTLFRASRSGSFHLFVLAAALSACIGVMGYGVISLEPSSTCGPFKGRERAYDVLLSKIGDAPTWIKETLVFLTTPAAIFFIIVILLFLVLYYRAKSTTHGSEARNLRNHLQFERKVEKRRMLARVNFQRGISIPASLTDLD